MLQLPRELLNLVFAFAPRSDLERLRCTSRALRVIANTHATMRCRLARSMFNELVDKFSRRKDERVMSIFCECDQRGGWDRVISFTCAFARAEGYIEISIRLVDAHRIDIERFEKLNAEDAEAHTGTLVVIPGEGLRFDTHPAIPVPQDLYAYVRMVMMRSVQ